MLGDVYSGLLDITVQCAIEDGLKVRSRRCGKGHRSGGRGKTEHCELVGGSSRGSEGIRIKLKLGFPTPAGGHRGRDLSHRHGKTAGTAQHEAQMRMKSRL
jgi:hypothetical protein